MNFGKLFPACQSCVRWNHVKNVFFSGGVHPARALRSDVMSAICWRFGRLACVLMTAVA